MTFPLDRLNEVTRSPEKFRLIEKVPFNASARLLKEYFPAVGDELTVTVLDTETTGLDAAACKIIELGMIALKWSPSAAAVQSVSRVFSKFQDPLEPIPEIITDITGITDEMVCGRVFDDADINSWLQRSSLVIAHNATFDRSFMDRRFPASLRAKWACSVKDVAWMENHRLPGRKLEYILFSLGYFYDPHRAISDCEALVQVFLDRPEVLAELVSAADRKDHVIRAIGSPFAIKDQLKARGYAWEGDENSRYGKHWHRALPVGTTIKAELSELQEFWPQASEKCLIDEVTAVDRHKTGF